MSSNTVPRPDHREVPAAVAYWNDAKRPLQILAFLLPLVVAYELCLALVLPAEDGSSVNTVLAHKSLLDFLGAFGIADAGGLFLGGLVIVVVLLVWHVLVRDPWRVDLGHVGVMAAEAFVLTLPLLVLGRLAAGSAVAASTPAPTSFAEFDVWSQMAISVGAGLYEELIFRMILIAVVHTLLVDVARVPNAIGTAIAILLSAVAFTWYHDLHGANGALSSRKLVFYLSAGTYFGLVYSLRGFGLVVGVHATYDVVTVLMRAWDSD